MHTTASDGRLTPAELVARAAAAGLHHDQRHRSRHRRGDRRGDRGRGGRRAFASCPASRSPPSTTAATCTCSAISSIRRARRSRRCSCSQRALRVERVREIAAPARVARHADRRRGVLLAARRRGRDRRSAVRSSRASWCAPVTWRRCRRRSIAGWRPGGRRSCRAPGPSPADVVETIHAAGGVASFAHPGVTKRDELIAPLAERGPRCDRGLSLRSHRRRRASTTAAWRARLDALDQRRFRFSRRGLRRDGKSPARPQRSTLGAVTLPPSDFAALESAAPPRQGSGATGAS